jgi:hypothetical protein
MRKGFRVPKNPCSELSLSRPTMTPKRRGAGGSHQRQSCESGEGEDQDGQVGHIIGPGWVMQFPASHYATNRVHKM